MSCVVEKEVVEVVLVLVRAIVLLELLLRRRRWPGGRI